MIGPVEGLYRIEKKDISEAGTVLKDAFQHDPLWGKVFEHALKRDQKLSAFFQTPVIYCLKYGAVYAPSENLEGVAALVPGDLADMTFWRLLRSGALWTGMKIGGTLSRRLKQVFEPIQKDREENMGHRSFVYVQLIGVASALQGKGFGGRMLRVLIAKSEQLGVPLYLETETEENVSMYERFGFTLLKQITLPVVHLPMWEMVKNP